jgi:hypothetical protein
VCVCVRGVLCGEVCWTGYDFSQGVDCTRIFANSKREFVLCLVYTSVFCAQTEIYLNPIAQILQCRPVLPTSTINRNMATCFDLCLSFRSLSQALHLIYNYSRLLGVDFRLLQRCKLDFRSPGMLRCVEWQLVTDVSAQTIRHLFKRQADCLIL